jgi:hypothetical protein
MAFSLPVPKFDPWRLFANRIRHRHRAPGLFGRFRLAGLSGPILLGLGLGSLAAAAFAAIPFFRRNAPTRARSNPAESLDLGPYATREKATMDWIVAGRGMDTLTPAAYAIPVPEQSMPVESVFADPAPGAGSTSEPNPFAQPGSGPGSPSPNEPWTDTVRRAMEKKPLSFGYDKSAWTAPLLGQYLMETHGVKVPVPRLRNALRDMGYHWKHTHYARARPQIGRSHQGEG